MRERSRKDRRKDGVGKSGTEGRRAKGNGGGRAQMREGGSDEEKKGVRIGGREAGVRHRGDEPKG